jgi:hypothetical protein
VAVLFGLVAGAALIGGALASGWRTVRAVRMAWFGTSALHVADAALAAATAGWTPAHLAAWPVGERRSVPVADMAAGGMRVSAAAVRTGPLTAWVEAEARSTVAGTAWGAGRRVARQLRVEPPRLPLEAAITALGTLDLATVHVDALADTLADACGPRRAPSGWPAIHGVAVRAGDDAVLAGGVLPLDAARRDDAVARLDVAWAAMRRVAPGGDAAGWRLRHVPSPGLAVRAPLRHRGLLLVEGDVVLDAPLDVEGALVVRGALRGAGALRVRGAVLVRDAEARGSRLPDGSAVRLDRCAIAFALATVAGTKRHDAGTWSERPR